MTGNADLSKAYEFCREVGGWREQMIALSIQLRDDAIASEVKSGLEIRRYESGLAIELFVDVDLVSGSAITLWIDLRPDASDCWDCESSILTMRGSEQQVVKKIEESDASSLTALSEFVRRSLAIFAKADPGGGV